MINANELRIGNFVEFEGEFLPILSVDSEKELGGYGWKGAITMPHYWREKVVGHLSKWCEQISPIPLTEQWLLKFGFEPYNEPGAIKFIKDKDRYTSLYIFNAGDFWSPVINRIDEKRIFELYGIKHVHQLQNLFFALTGTELQYSGVVKMEGKG